MLMFSCLLIVPLNHKNLDPLLDQRGLEAQCIKDFLSGVKRWESMTNLIEPGTMKMVLHMHEKCNTNHPDSLHSVLHDWNVLSIFYGFRLSKWEQKSSDKMQPLSEACSLLLAFDFSHLIFLGECRSTVPRLWSEQLHDTGIEFV